MIVLQIPLLTPNLLYIPRSSSGHHACPNFGTMQMTTRQSKTQKDSANLSKFDAVSQQLQAKLPFRQAYVETRCLTVNVNSIRVENVM